MATALFDHTGEALSQYAAVTNSTYRNGIQFTTTDAITVEYYVFKAAGVYGDSPNNITGSIYTDSSGSVGDLVSNSSKTAGIPGTDTVTFTLDSPLSLSASTTYWLVFVGVGSAYVTIYRGNGSHRINEENTYYYDSKAFTMGLYYQDAAATNVVMNVI